MSTRIEKNTKKLVEKKLNALFSMQQQLNGDASGDTMQWGGYGPAGGYTQSNYNWGNLGNGFGQDRYQTNFGLDPLSQVNQFRPMYTGDLPTGIGGGQSLTGMSTSNIATGIPDYLKYSAPDDQMNIKPEYGSFVNDAPSNIKYSNPKDNPFLPGFKATPGGVGGLDWKKAGTFAGQMAPMLYNMAKGLQRPTRTRAQYNPYEGSARSLMANRRFNIDPLLEANRTGQAVANRNIGSAANSRGELMANLGASQNYRMRGDSAAWAQKSNMDNQYMGEQAQMDAQLGGQRAQMDWMTQVANEQNRAQRNQFMGQGFSDLGRFTQMQQLMANQAKNSENLGRIYQDAWGGLTDFMKETQKVRAQYNIPLKNKR